VIESQNGERPLAYQAVANDLRRALSDGVFSNGRRLPTEAELSEQYQVSRQTVRRAFQDLVAEGLIYRVRGRGSFAAPAAAGAQYLRSFGSIDDLLALSEDTEMETLSPLERRADVGAASRLNLPTDQVIAGFFRRLHQDVPFMVTRVFMPPDVGKRVIESGGMPAVGERTPATVVSLVERVSPQAVVGAHQSITATSIPADLAAAIDRQPGEPVLRIDRLYLDATGKPVELAIAHFNPERYSYRLELRRSPRASGS
jgi:GntR family transcriptional regulator